MNLLAMDKSSLYLSYKSFEVNECYSSLEHVKDVVRLFPEHEDEITSMYKTGNYDIDSSSRMAYKIFGHRELDSYCLEIQDNVDIRLNNLDYNVNQWDFYQYTYKNELSRDMIEDYLINTNLLFAYTRYNATIMYDIIGMKLLDRLYEHDIELLELFNGGFTIRDDVNYGVRDIPIINKYHECFSSSLKSSLIEDGYMDPSYIEYGTTFNLYNDHQIDILDLIQEIDKIHIVIHNPIHSRYIRYNMNLGPNRIPIHELIYYMDYDTITIHDPITILGSYSGDIIKAYNKYKRGALRLWYKYHNNSTVVHAYTTYLPNIVRKSNVLIHPMYLSCISWNNLLIPICGGFSDIIINFNG